MVLDSKIEMINNCTENLAINIEERNLNNSEDSSHHNHLNCWLVLEVSATKN